MNDSEREWLEQLADWHGSEATKHPEGRVGEPRNFHQTAARLIRVAIDTPDSARVVQGHDIRGAATKMCDEFRKEFHSGAAEDEHWPGWVDGFDPREPIDAAYLALAASLAGTESQERHPAKSRFFVDHGAVHDRVTGQHVGMESEAGHPERLLALLQELEGYRPMKLHVSNDALRRQITADPDDEPSAGGQPKMGEQG